MPELRIPMDPFNPGQYYACCGLFELAARESHAQARFNLTSGSIRRREFLLQTDEQFELHRALAGLRDAKYEVFDDAVEAAIRPVRLYLPSGELVLDWWLDWFWQRPANLKCWAGQVTTRKLMDELLNALPVEAGPEHLLFEGKMMKSKFGIDPRAAWNSLDLGFSPNEHNQDAATFPAVELLGAIGLQGFRPLERKRDDVPMYLWTSWLAAVPARRAAIRPWPGLPNERMSFQIAKRGQSYKYFTFAKPGGTERNE